jgi:16S rRNA (guanine527-N7)-methyltransferase
VGGGLNAALLFSLRSPQNPALYKSLHLTIFANMSNNTANWQTIVKEQEFNDLIMEWNPKINLVSRQKLNVLDLIEDSKLFFDAIDFTPGINILDLGTGGGFPGIVIAINHPEANLVLVDSIQKKINVVKDIIKRLELTNVKAICSRVEDLIKPPVETHHMRLPADPQNQFQNNFDCVVARSVTVLQDLAKWSKPLLKPGGKLISVKGGDIKGEIHSTRKLPYIKNVFVKTAGERLIVTAEFI